MIELYVKSGLIRKKPVIAFILKAPKHRWLKTKVLEDNLTKKQLESMGCLIALSHIKRKHYKDNATIYTDSTYLLDILDMDADGNFIRQNTSVDITKHLRYLIKDMGRIQIMQMPDDEDCEELHHVYQECGLDHIELEEKD